MSQILTIPLSIEGKCKIHVGTKTGLLSMSKLLGNLKQRSLSDLSKTLRGVSMRVGIKIQEVLDLDLMVTSLHDVFLITVTTLQQRSFWCLQPKARE